jgi:hypothetical protein
MTVLIQRSTVHPYGAIRDLGAKLLIQRSIMNPYSAIRDLGTKYNVLTWQHF